MADAVKDTGAKVSKTRTRLHLWTASTQQIKTKIANLIGHKWVAFECNQFVVEHNQNSSRLNYGLLGYCFLWLEKNLCWSTQNDINIQSIPIYGIDRHSSFFNDWYSAKPSFPWSNNLVLLVLFIQSFRLCACVHLRCMHDTLIAQQECRWCVCVCVVTATAAFDCSCYCQSHAFVRAKHTVLEKEKMKETSTLNWNLHACSCQSLINCIVPLATCHTHTRLKVCFRTLNHSLRLNSRNKAAMGNNSEKHQIKMALVYNMDQLVIYNIMWVGFCLHGVE